jgi:hypothetical protein
MKSYLQILSALNIIALLFGESVAHYLRRLKCVIRVTLDLSCPDLYF